MTEPRICITCKKPKAAFDCIECTSCTCKACTYFLDEESFSFLPKLPTGLQLGTYCRNCFDAKVSDHLVDYNETMEKAKHLYVYMKHQGKETRLMNRKEDPIVINECLDEQETIVRMAFIAVKMGFNSLLDVEVKTKKIINGSHKYTQYSGSSVPYKMSADEIQSADRNAKIGRYHI